LHTRTFLVLPQSHSQQQHATSDVAPEEEAQRTRARAQVAFQQVTKETDDGIAQAYVALAEGSDSEPDVASLKAGGEKKESRRMRISLQERALDRTWTMTSGNGRRGLKGGEYIFSGFQLGSQDGREKVGWRRR